MNWQDDPAIQEQIRERSVRFGILRSAILWTPLFAATGGAFLFFIFDQVTDGGRGTVFLVVVLGIFATLFGFQSIHALLDLKGSPQELVGTVTRRWTRSDSLVMRTHYVRVERTILRGDPVMLHDIREGDRVTAKYYPHTAVLVTIEKVRPPEPADDDAAAVDASEPSAAGPQPRGDDTSPQARRIARMAGVSASDSTTWSAPAAASAPAP